MGNGPKVRGINGQPAATAESLLHEHALTHHNHTNVGSPPSWWSTWSTSLSHQCGFSLTVHGNLLPEADQWTKLARTVEVAREVWGD